VDDERPGVTAVEFEAGSSNVRNLRRSCLGLHETEDNCKASESWRADGGRRKAGPTLVGTVCCLVEAY
jgi:hypothetical protein